MTLVVDASTLVSALVDGGPEGRWANELLASEPLAAPHLLHVEVAHVLRKAEAAGQISSDVAAMAHANLMDVAVELFPYVPHADRIWELRANVTSYDAWYVALAEELYCPLATMDLKLTKAAGPHCEFLTFSASA